MTELGYKEIAAIALQRRSANIPKEYLLSPEKLQTLGKDLTLTSTDPTIYTAEEIQIINSHADQILQNIHSGQWTAVQVSQAFCKSATIAQQLTNCLTEILFKEALEQAAILDAHFASTGKPIGPLHGLPISLKDNFITPPHPASIGMSNYANTPSRPEEETVLVGILRSLGAIIHVKTNVPTAMMMMETDNMVWGSTRNPVHSGCNAGGSSGGECALVAMRGTPIGIGTDIGGSIRIPAAFCGLYGLKPSYGRYPQWGGRSGIPGNEFILAVNGPIARHPSSLAAYSAAVLSSLPAASPWLKDPKALPLPWRVGPHIVPPGRKLRIGIAPAADGLVTSHPPVERALSLTQAALTAAGHDVIPWPVTDHPEIVKLLLTGFIDFGSKPMLDLLNKHGEPVFGAMKMYEAAADAGRLATGDVNGEQPITPTRVREMNIARNALCKAYLDRWVASGVDAIIMPSTPWAAVREGFTNAGIAGNHYFGYTGVFSLLDMSVCTFPVTKASRDDRPRKDGDWTCLGDLDARIQADYDEVFYEGAPVALQCVGERLAEEKVLEIVGVVRDALDRM